ncbi:hypothetical protein Tco_0396702 [Tanacetum coccineum]
MSKRQPGTGGSMRNWKPTKAFLMSPQSSLELNEGNWIQARVPDEEKLSSISHLLNQYLLPVKNHSLQLSPPTSALQQSSSVLEMVKSRLLCKSVQDLRLL